MRILVQNDWRNKAIFVIVLLMPGGLFVSRAMLSVSTIVFIVLCCAHNRIVDQLRYFLKSPLLISISFLFFIPLFSGIWSKDLTEWAEILVVKLPFLLLPVAFAGDWKLHLQQQRMIAVGFIIFTVLACCWSLGIYLSDMQAINENYLRAKTIPTLLSNDHVRFSWLVFLAILLATFLLEKDSRKGRIWLIMCIIFLVVYLHLLSARTGLVMFYLSTFCYATYKLRSRPVISLAIAAGVVVLLTVGWYCFPTFSNRIRYNLYDLSFVLKNEYRSGTSDGNRLASLKAGWAILKEHPLTGVGAGDVWNEARRWYDEHITGLNDSDKLYPSNEWLAHGCIAGWPGIILFTVIIAWPLSMKNIRHRFFWTTFHLSSVILFMVETSLEMQHGVFIYAFFGLSWWKWHCFKAE